MEVITYADFLTNHFLKPSNFPYLPHPHLYQYFPGIFHIAKPYICIMVFLLFVCFVLSCLVSFQDYLIPDWFQVDFLPEQKLASCHASWKPVTVPNCGLLSLGASKLSQGFGTINLIFIIIPRYLPLCLSFSPQCTAEFSRDCVACGITASWVQRQIWESRCLPESPALKAFATMQNNATNFSFG